VSQGRRPFLGLRADRLTAESRGVGTLRADHARRIDEAAAAFALGYDSGLTASGPPGWAAVERAAVGDGAGFVVEGAAMAATVRDLLRPGRGMAATTALWESTGRRHPHTFHCGVGWGFAVLGRRPRARWAALDPLLRWLAYDGLGFCHAFIGGPAAGRVKVPQHWSAAERAVAFQGIGRAQWFLTSPRGVGDRIRAYPAHVHQDLWAGVGLAAGYAGGDPRDLAALVDDAGAAAADLAVGAVCAAAARHHGEVWTDTADAALDVLARLGHRAAIELHDACLADLDPVAEPEAYLTWRARVRSGVVDAAASRTNGARA